MAIQTKDEAQSKVDKKVDRSFYKKKKYVPLREETWADLNQRGASLADQLEWIKLKKNQSTS